MLWSEYLGDDEGRDTLLAYKGQAFEYEGLTIYPQIIENSYSGDVGLKLTIKYGDIVLTHTVAWGIGLLGVPYDPDNQRYIQEILNGILPGAVHEAHRNIVDMIVGTQSTLKTLREARDKLGVVILTHEGNSIKLSLTLARQVLLIRANGEGDIRALSKPFRLQRATPDVAIVWNDVNRVIGAIGFDPTNPDYRTTKGRFGLYNLDVTPEEQS